MSGKMSGQVANAPSKRSRLKRSSRSPGACGLPELLTAEEVAAWLGKSVRAVYAMVERGQLPGVIHVGRRLLFEKQVLVRWLDERRALSPTESQR